MKTEKNIFIAFLLNVSFSIIEFIGGLITNSVAITSDAIHDLGDALSIGISFVLEKMSRNKPNEKYTYGYIRYSVLGAFITSSILLIGSVFVIFSSIKRIMNPVDVNYNGMIFLSIFGIVINFLAAYFTHEGDSLNQKSVNLHMLEDVLGWLIVFVGSILIKFTNINYIDSIMSFGVAIFILINVFKNMKEVLDLFLVKTPNNIEINKIINHIKEIESIIDVHHVHIWSLDNISNYATLHVVTNNHSIEVKNRIKDELKEFNIYHSTIEFEKENENCESTVCKIDSKKTIHNHNHKH